MRTLYHKIRRIFQDTPLSKKIFTLSLPVFLEMISHTLVQVADTIMVGKLGPVATAATGLGGMAYFTGMIFVINASTGVQILTARRFGEKDFKAVGKIALTSVYFSAFAGVGLGIVGYYTAFPFVSLLNEDKVIIEKAGSYLAFRSMGTVFFFLIFVFRAFLNGLGKTYIGMLTAFTVTLSNIFLNWVLIYGNLGFNGFGIDGAAIASSISGFIGFLFMSLFFFKKEINTFFNGISHQFDFQILSEVFRIGFPPGIDGVFTHFAFLIFSKFSGMIGMISLASTSIIMTIIGISFMPGFAFGIAATTILGQAMGAGKIRLAERGAFRSALYSAILMGCLGIVFIAFGRQIIEIFSQNPDVLADAYPALIIIALIQAGDAYHMVIGSALRSAGLVYWVMVIYLFYSFGLMLPLAYFMGIYLKMGTTGIWLSVFIWLLGLSLTFIWKFKKGDWKTIKI
ncbi:MAG: MATE family efflux transporter [Leptospira sp.]|nr:MATE family efflux transporter [Leptospira sp.]